MKKTALGAAVVALFLMATPVLAAGPEKVYVCHAAGQEGTLKYVTLYVPANEGGYPQGHFTESGTQAAGHEHDYLGQCEEDQPSPSPTPTPSPTPSETPSPTSEPTPTPTVEPTPSPTPTAAPTPTATPEPTKTPAPPVRPTNPPTDTIGVSTETPTSLPLALMALAAVFAGSLLLALKRR